MGATGNRQKYVIRSVWANCSVFNSKWDGQDATWRRWRCAVTLPHACSCASSTSRLCRAPTAACCRPGQPVCMCRCHACMPRCLQHTHNTARKSDFSTGHTAWLVPAAAIGTAWPVLNRWHIIRLQQPVLNASPHGTWKKNRITLRRPANALSQVSRIFHT